MPSKEESTYGERSYHNGQPSQVLSTPQEVQMPFEVTDPDPDPNLEALMTQAQLTQATLSHLKRCLDIVLLRSHH